MVTVAFADWLGAATDVAVTVTVGGAGTLAGAVYKPEAEMDPHAEPEQPELLLPSGADLDSRWQHGHGYRRGGLNIDRR
jgi:hypothetical protein